MSELYQCFGYIVFPQLTISTLDFCSFQSGYSHVDRLYNSPNPNKLLSDNHIQDAICNGKDLFGMFAEAYKVRDQTAKAEIRSCGHLRTIELRYGRVLVVSGVIFCNGLGPLGKSPSFSSYLSLLLASV